MLAKIRKAVLEAGKPDLINDACKQKIQDAMELLGSDVDG